MRHENLVAAAEANAQDNGECGEVACENAGGHGGGAHVNDHRGDEHLEKLKADGFCGGGEAYANPVGENSAGAFDVSAVREVLDFKAQHKPKNDGCENPRKCGGKADSVHAHFRESPKTFQKDVVHRGVRGDGDEVSDEVPDGESVRGDEGGERRLQCAECKPECDNAHELFRVFGGIVFKPHPNGNVARNRKNQKRERNAEEETPDDNHRLR